MEWWSGSLTVSCLILFTTRKCARIRYTCVPYVLNSCYFHSFHAKRQGDDQCLVDKDYMYLKHIVLCHPTKSSFYWIRLAVHTAHWKKRFICMTLKRNDSFGKWGWWGNRITTPMRFFENFNSGIYVDYCDISCCYFHCLKISILNKF